MTAHLPICPTELPAGLVAPIRECAEVWRGHPARPVVSEAVLGGWDELLEAWAAGPAPPLLVRKFRGNRGHSIIHRTGRTVVPTDNSPAQWAFSLALSGVVPTLELVGDTLSKDRLPVAMILPRGEREAADYRATLGNEHSLNTRGWKLAHIASIGLRTRTPVNEVPMNDLTAHFRRFMSPRNMFLVPKSLAGVAEVPEFIEPFAADAGMV